MTTIKNKKTGSALIWALVVAVVLFIALAIGLAAVSSSMNVSTSRHADKQSYYTAMSIAKAYADWLRDASYIAPALRAKRAGFMKFLENGPFRHSFDEKSLGSRIGSCELEIEYANKAYTSIRITAAARFQEERSVVNAVLNIRQIRAYPSGSFSTARYDAEAAALNAIVPDPNPVNVFGKMGSSSGVSFGTSDYPAIKRDYNYENQIHVNSSIADASSAREATWLETTGTGGGTALSGPRDTPNLGEALFESGKAPFASTRVVTPLNGRFAFNPISEGTGDSYGPSASSSNTKYAAFNIDDTNGKDVLIRLANGAGLQKRTYSVPRNALVSFDFTDNKYSDVTDSKGNFNDPTGSAIAGKGNNQLRYWPVKWNKARIYTRDDANETINSNLLFGPYYRIWHGDTMDYRGWAHYRNNHKGGTDEYWEYCEKMLTNIGYKNAYYERLKNNKGIPNVSVEWGDNIGIYILDDTDKYVRFTQGVNIMNGVVYSARDTQIGGGIVWRSSGSYSDNIFNGYAGFSGEPYNFTLYPPFTCTQNQVISGTDIVLLAPAGKSRNSIIRHPDSWRNFEGRKLTIDGGVIYLGTGQNLTIQGEVKDGLTVEGIVSPGGTNMTERWPAGEIRNYLRYTENGNRMDISPDRIIVEEGASLTIMANHNDHANVTSDIFVRGTLNIESDAKISGNIYVFGDNGAVNIDGDFRMDSKDGDMGGIFVCGENEEDENGKPIGVGTVSAPQSLRITGTGGKIHLLNSNCAGVSVDALCSAADPNTELCAHPGKASSNKPDSWSVQYSGS
ncbi:MAG: hypothetical protein LBH63_03075 [Clostridiales Family XIII bacterium]|jgi:hypothetical protein|nr:hypothetical protein [Clostridiales Family XIII bacterium]